MPKIVLIILWIQYIGWMVFKTTTTYTFWVLDFILHILFAIQSIWALYLVYMYINWKSAQNMNEKTRSIVNTVVNLVIFLAVLIFSVNIINVFFIDTLINIF